MGLFTTDCHKDEYGLRNDFRKLITKQTKKYVELGYWPILSGKETGSQKNLFNLVGKSGLSLLEVLHETDMSEDMHIVAKKYLLKHYLCYIEYSTSAYSKKGAMYQKKLVTGDLSLVKAWMGCLEENDYKKCKKILEQEPEKDSIPYIELKYGKDGTPKITKPRKQLDLNIANMNIIPVFMLSAAVKTLVEHLNTEYVKFTYVKDNGQVRSLTSTLNKDLIISIYGHPQKKPKTKWSREAFEQMYSGKLVDCVTLPRGYIRLPEVGGSRYDDPTRSVNLARITHIEYGVQPDLSVVDVKLDMVTTRFYNYLSEYPQNKQQILSIIQKSSYTDNLENLDVWASTYADKESTEFKKYLAKMMLDNTSLFPNYKNTCGEDIKSSSIINITMDDIDF
jgi:hypothetical protein